jgi:hypothetical protein
VTKTCAGAVSHASVVAGATGCSACQAGSYSYGSGSIICPVWAYSMLCACGFLQAHNDGEVPGEEVANIKHGETTVSAQRLPSLMSWYCDGPGFGGKVA